MKNFWDYILFFKRSEFACRCGCGFSAVDIELLSILIDLRHKFGPVVISGPNRCEKHNRNVGGAKKSYHTKGMAVDASFKNTELNKVWEYLLKTYPNDYGFILYKSWIHIDVRQKKYRETK